MCGIAGFTGPCSSSQLQRFQESLHHRGPDETGQFCGESIGLSHNRLAIIDLNTGRQPILNEDKTCAIVFNGEIYNYQELREQLRHRHQFNTETDTEVILHLYEECGTDVTKHLKGDFAFCIWDGRNQSCFLSRDPLGVKPLFYCITTSENLVFSSEIRTILRHPDVGDEIDADSLSEYLTRLYVSAPRTILKNVRKLGPGESLVWKAGSVRKWQHWSIPEPLDRGQTVDSIRERAHESLKIAVKRRLIADVPVGAFLSGGLDSSLIVALASQHSRGLHTFSIGYGEPDFDELRYARLVSKRYGTNHHEFVIQPRAEDLIQDVIDAVDEPVGDSSAIPTYLIARETRKHVKVALSGIGGDEMFFGYPRYLGAKLSEIVPGVLRRPIARAAGLWSSQPRGRDIGGWIRRFGKGLELNPEARYAMWTTFLDPQTRSGLLPDIHSAAGFPEREIIDALRRGAGSSLDRIFRFDVLRYVSADLLQLCDNMTMAHSLEARVPFCDVDLVAEMAGTAASIRFPGYRLKPILRNIAREYLPDEILNRRKQGFMVPIGRWFRNDLKDYVASHLDNGSLPAGVDGRFVRGLWERHLSGQANHTHVLWAILVLGNWLRKSSEMKSRH